MWRYATILLHQNMTQICFKSFKVSKWRFSRNVSEFQDISVREFQFDGTEYGRWSAYDCFLFAKNK